MFKPQRHFTSSDKGILWNLSSQLWVLKKCKFVCMHEQRILFWFIFMDLACYRAQIATMVKHKQNHQSNQKSQDDSKGANEAQTLKCFA